MKSIIKIILPVLLLSALDASAQNTAISDVPYTPAASAVLDVYSTSKGFLVPRMTLAQKTAISAPATGLLIYQTNSSPGFYYYDGTQWIILSNGPAWVEGGNSVASLKTVGTISNYDVPFIANNTEKMRLTTTGQLAIGSVAFNALNPERLLVDYGTTTSTTLATFRGSINNYLQVNIQNTSNGSDASTDFVATADNGTDSTNYIDMGINSSTYAPSVDNFGGPNDGYLYTYSRHLVIGTAASSSDIIFLVNGGQLSVNQAMRIDGGSKNIIVGRRDNSTAPVGNTIRGPNGSGTNISGGSLTILGGNATGSGTGGAIILTGGNTVSGSGGAVNINVNSNNAANINTGTNTQNVTIGGSSNNIILPKFTTIGGIYYNATAGGQLGGAAQLIWDNVNTRLGIGIAAPVVTLQVNGTAGLGNAGPAGTNGLLTFYNSANANTVSVNSGTTTVGYTLTLPVSVAGVNGQVLTSTTAGVLSWTTPGPAAAITSFNGLTGATQTLANGATGTAPAWTSAGSSHTLNIPLAATATVTAGLLSNANWTTFNTKEAALTFSTGLTRVTNTITNNLSTGVSGGQSVTGGTAASNNLTLSSTTNATKGKLIFGTSAYDEVNNRLGLGTATPTATLELKAGTAAANTAPLKFNSGVNLTAPQNGVMEYDGTNYFATSGGIRYTLAKTLTNTTSWDVPSTATGSSSVTTITVTGAVNGDVVAVGIPGAIQLAVANQAVLFAAYVSAANTVTFRFTNFSGVAFDPGVAATYRVSVIRY